MKIYLDTCILTHLVDGRWDLQDSELIKKIWEIKTVSFWASNKTLEEINNIPDEEFRKKVMAEYNKVNKTPSIPSLSTSLSKFGSSSSTQDPDLTELIELLKTEYPRRKVLSVIENSRGKMITNDAYHIYYARMANCDAFLTGDRRTIIKRYEKNKNEFNLIIGNMKIVDPPTLLNLLIAS